MPLLTQRFTACAPVLQVKTSPFDPRFPTTNQAKNCYTRYNEFHKCVPLAATRAALFRPPGKGV
jgi:cytochrome c oxidase subunit 6b